VYKAYDPEINRVLAIKVLRSQFRENREHRLRFLREAKGAGVLSHPNIVTVFDVGEQDDQPYMAMELVEGSTLAELTKGRQALPVKQAVEIGIQLAKALDYAHTKGIVHRDVKPANIMLLKDAHTIKVADFGICRIDNSDVTEATQAGTVLGTLHYMSPEQVLGQKVDSRSDLFSAGVVLYQLFTGRLPFEGDTMMRIALNITQGEPEPLDRVRPDLPLSLRRVVDRALKRPVDRRFQTGGEMAEALIAVLRELNEAEHADERGRIVPMRVRWALIMASLVAGTILLTAGLLYQRQYAAMMDQVMGYGGSLAKFVATQSAVPVLMEDWASTDVFVQETSSRQNFSYLQVLDHRGMVRGSTTPEEVGKPRVAPQGATPVTTRETGVNVVSHKTADGREVLDFSVPVLFQGRSIGQVHLGIYQTPLAEVARLTLIMLGVLLLVTSAAVAVGSYLLAQRLSAPMRVLRNSLGELAKGRYDYRIGESRKDEFGELYAEFDKTAEALEQRHDTLPPTSPPEPVPVSPRAATVILS